MTTIEAIVVGPSGIIDASIAEVLSASIDEYGDTHLCCEVDASLPSVKWQFFLLRPGDEVPVIERPTRTQVVTFSDEPSYIDGVPERVSPVFCCVVSDQMPPVFLYRLAEQ